jgi:hypothetical protein
MAAQGQAAQPASCTGLQTGLAFPEASDDVMLETSLIFFILDN